MASRLKAPAGSKLARPVPTGTGLKAPSTGLKQSGGGTTRPSPQPSGPTYDREGPPMTRTTPVGGVRKPVGQQARIAGTTGQGQQSRMLTANSSGRPSQQPSPIQSSSTSIVPESNGTVANFHVGDRVLVGGVKPGVIAFLGTTQFAKGIWAGIILDTFEGKNNGSVAGVQYFECESNRGLFSKPEKLKLESKTQNPTDKNSERSSGKFKVGDQVLVDGVKSGVIGFVGQTQFARGVWVGVILDTAEGKNNGCVGGVQYFDCAPNHGLFTRLQKLTYVEPKPSPVHHRPPVGANIPPVQQAQAQISRGSSLEGSSRASSSQPTDAAQLKTLRDKLKLGDHVLVGGVKEGILRFLGTTEFAKGVWAGVELPEPLGKNDGAVSGKRYFQCEPKHGLFAPLPKVEKLATAGSEGSATGLSAVSSTTSMTPPPQARQPPSPSIVKVPRGVDKPPIGATALAAARRLSESSTSSLGSARIPQLKAATAEAAATNSKDMAIYSLKGSTAANLSHLLQEKEKTIASLQKTLEERETEKQTHQEELTELRRKVDDLQFLLEEQGIISGDTLEMATETSAQNLSNLQQQLDNEKENSKRLQQHIENLQASGAANSDSDSAQLKNQLADIQAELGEKTKEVTDHLTIIKNLRSEVESIQSSREKALAELKELRSKSSASDAQFAAQLEEAQTTAADLHLKLKCTEDRCQMAEDQKTKLEVQIAQLSEMSGDSAQQMAYLNDQLREKDRLVEELQGEKGSLTGQLERINRDVNLKEEKLMAEQEQLHLSLRSEKERTLLLEKELTQADEVANDLQVELTSTQQELQEALDLRSQHEALIEERNSELNDLEVKVRSLTKEKELWSSERLRFQQEQERLSSERNKALANCDQLMAQSASSSSQQDEMAQQRRELLSEKDQLLTQQRVLQTDFEKVIGERDEMFQQLSELQQQKQDIIGEAQQMSLKCDSTQKELTLVLKEVEDLKQQAISSQEKWEYEKLRLKEDIEVARASSTELQQKINDMVTERDSTLQQAQEMSERLDNAEKERDQLQIAFESSQNQVEELQFQLEEITSQHKILEQESNAESIVIQRRLETTEELLTERERELAEARERVITLSDDLLASQGKNDQAMLEEEKLLLEEEKLLLEERVEELTLQLEKAQTTAGVPGTVGTKSGDLDNETISSRLEEAHTQLLIAKTEHEKLQQTIAEYEQQATDLQRKLETAETMAGLHGPIPVDEDEPGDYSYGDEEDDDDIAGGLPPPRLFCDICDVFDEHDTDDCPLQAASDSPPHSMHHGKRAPGGSDRPYCDNCEVFGHWTDSCEYDMTY